MRQRSRILEQIRELKRIDVDTFHYETLYQVRESYLTYSNFKTLTDDFEKQIDEMKILEIKSRMAARILEIHEVIFEFIYWNFFIL